MDPAQMVFYSRSGEIPRAVRAGIERAMDLRQRLTDLDVQVAGRTQKISAISAEQGRIRENMKTVGQTSQYYERLLGKLNEQESQIEQLQKERDALAATREAAQRELTDYLANLTLN
jgi:predicted  nucleic acid-binding Zn-ribbon protein